MIQQKYHTNSKGRITNHYRAKTKVNIIRYADDFVITTNSKVIAMELREHVREFFHER